MPYPYYPDSKQQASPPPPPPDLSGSRLLIVLGVASIVFAGIIGVGIGVAVLLLTGRRLGEYEKRPSRWSRVSVQRIRTARTLAIVGCCVSALAVCVALVFVIVEWDSVQGYF
ncbi:MAG: hypothetical protein MUC87_03405 [Bacteroidia bacterium]|jgi:hypothetical protein|nr:hypothetical protein [Bacteroidia bacterium]